MSTPPEYLTKHLPTFGLTLLYVEFPSQRFVESQQNTVLVVHATWSGPSIINCTKTFKALRESNFTGEVYITDIDDITPQAQLKLFGRVCHGYAEALLIQNGKITATYTHGLSKDNMRTIEGNLTI